jgi:hypothetical protein
MLADLFLGQKIITFLVLIKTISSYSLELVGMGELRSKNPS